MPPCCSNHGSAREPFRDLFPGSTPVSWSLGSTLRAETPMGAACEPTARTLLPPRRMEGPSSGPGALRSSASREATSEVNTLS